MASDAILSTINYAAIPLSFPFAEYGSLFDWIGKRRFVLIGEASHGTHDFYRERAQITQRLIEEKGFNTVAIEGDWPDAYRVNRFVTGFGEDADAHDALGDFARFPAWMWRNMDVLAFVDWLRNYNQEYPLEKKVRFYGLDLYSLHASIRAVLEYLDKVDPEAARRARYRYSCFDHFGEDPQAYGYAASFDLSQSCRDEVVEQLVDMRRRPELEQGNGRVEPDEYLFAEQNARLVQNAEHYYRAMFGVRAESWNVRDRHMAETLAWLYQMRPESKVVVWAHNSHLGDARATEMNSRGEVNLGQLAREQFGRDEVFLLGFTTYAGEVTAASQWGGPAERKIVRPALDDSYETLFHQTQIPAFLLSMNDERLTQALRTPRVERAIGVIYLPQTERVSHYFRCRLPDQFDAVIHIDRTQALIPFERTSGWEAGELPETYPHAV